LQGGKLSPRSTSVNEMQISNAQLNRVFELHLHRAYPRPLSSTSRCGIQDRLTISRQAVEMQNVKRHVLSLPDVRQDKVRQLRGMIENGSYEVSDHEVADAMFSDVGE
jgi:flagellar biosynthesis anti-sigma factor FlgM